MLLFSLKKVVVKVCFDFGRSENSLTPSVNAFSKVKGNCITVFTRLNTAKEPIHAAIKQMLPPTRRGRLFQHRKKRGKESKIKNKTSTRNNWAI